MYVLNLIYSNLSHSYVDRPISVMFIQAVVAPGQLPHYQMISLLMCALLSVSETMGHMTASRQLIWLAARPIRVQQTEGQGSP